MKENGNIFLDLKNFAPQPPEQVWKNIGHRLDAPKNGLSTVKKWVIGSTAGAVVVVGIVMVFLFLRNKENHDTQRYTENPMVEISAEIIAQPVPVEPAVETVSVTSNTVLDKTVIDHSHTPKSTVSSEKIIEIENPINIIPEKKQEEPMELKPQETVQTQPKSVEKAVPILPETPQLETPISYLEPEDSTETIEYIYVALNQDQSICRGEKAIMQVARGENVAWNTGETVRTLSVKPMETTEYQVTWQEEDQYYKSSIQIEVLDCSMFIPNAFTPNGDGINDQFRPVCEGIVHFRMLIFSQDGKQLFESKDITMGWDGIAFGQKMKEGTYIYRISFTDFTGHNRNMYGTFKLLP